MADSKITALTSISTSTDPANDPLVIVDVSDTSMAATGTTKKVTLNNLLACSPTATLASATITGDLTVATNAFAVRASDKKTFVGTAPISTAYKFYVTLGGTAGAIAQFTDGIAQTLTIDSAAGGLIVGNANNGYLAFYINGTERLRIDSSGNVSLATGNLVMSTSGKGIDFSATANSSGTMTSELLNDYEEGTWTPVVEGTTTAGTATYSTQGGRYTKVGRLVTFSMRIIYTGGTGTGNLRVGGLPFTVGFASTYATLPENIALNASRILVADSQSGDTKITFNQIPTGGGTAGTVAYDDAGDMQISGSYTV